MIDQDTPMFDAFEADLRKTESMDQVAATSAAMAWMAAALPVLHGVAMSVHEFTTDRLEYDLMKSGVGLPPEKRAIGPLMLSGATNGWIQKTERVFESVMPSNHRRPKTVWRSMIK